MSIIPPQSPNPYGNPAWNNGATPEADGTPPAPSTPPDPNGASPQQPDVTPAAANPTISQSPYVSRYSHPGAYSRTPAGSAQPSPTQPTPAQSAPAQPNPARPIPAQEHPAPAGPPTFTPPAGAATPRSALSQRRSGPGWGAIVAAMVATALASVGISAAVVGNGNSSARFDYSASSTGFTQSGEELVDPVTSTIDAPDWIAVAAAVRPATVSIDAYGDSSAGTGSGVIIDSEGHIVTNHHVISDVVSSGDITVTLSDGRLYSAEIVGTDSTTDLAVLKLQDAPSDLVAARLVSSSTLKAGQPVMAIGSPLGLTDTVTTGVVSALDRPVVMSRSEVDSNSGQQVRDNIVTNAIQIDASINPGNSGGPLFDANGSVVGINSSIATVSDSSSEAGSIGLGFAIPSDLVSNVVAQILETGQVQHALLGVQIGTGVVDVGANTITGALVSELVTGGAAEAAGLQPGDVITGINGDVVGSGPALTGFVRRYQSGDEVVLTVVRDGVETQVPVTLQAKTS